MSRVVATSLNLVFLIGSALGQSGFVNQNLGKMNDEERAVLRKGFKLPDSATITEVKKRSFAPGAPLKLCLETILDPDVRQDVANWIAEWNQKEPDQSRRLEIVADSLQADVSVLRYVRPPPPNSLISKLVFTDPQGNSQAPLLAYSYLMVRKSDALEILWRKVSGTYQGEHKLSAKVLANELKDLMKERGKR